MDKVSRPGWQLAQGALAFLCALESMLPAWFASGRLCVSEFTVPGFLNAGLGLVIFYFPYLCILGCVAALAAAWPRKRNHAVLDIAVILVAMGCAILSEMNSNLAWLAIPFLMIVLGCLTRLVPSFRTVTILSALIGLVIGVVVFMYSPAIGRACYP